MYVPNKKNVENFEVPNSVLGQIDECSGGGFVLFTVDETGSPQVYLKYDNPGVALIFQNFIKLWAESTYEANLARMTESIIEEDINPDSD